VRDSKKIYKAWEKRAKNDYEVLEIKKLTGAKDPSSRKKRLDGGGVLLLIGSPGLSQTVPEKSRLGHDGLLSSHGRFGENVTSEPNEKCG